jgi:ribosomal protein S18 acetylase RimI-like enzyme
VASWFINHKKTASNSGCKKREKASKIYESPLISDAVAIRQWAGPSVTFPCSIDSLGLFIKKGFSTSFVLKYNEVILGFGQLQLLKHKAHLARLVINPEYRGRGLGKHLLSELIQQADKQVRFEKISSKHASLKQVSLFVNIENFVAIACYQKFGFAESVMPAGISAPADCRYMTLHF